MADARTYGIVLLESSEIVAEGLRRILAGSEFSIVGTADGDIRAAMEDIQRAAPDIVIVNPALLSESARRSTLRSICPQLHDKVLAAFVHTLFDEEQLRGFDAVISIYDSAQQVVRKLRKAMESAGAAQTQSDGYELSEREREILVSVARGLTNKEIADQHNISIHTVISHRKNISRKTGIKTIAGLTVYALLNNMIDEADMES